LHQFTFTALGHYQIFRQPTFFSPNGNILIANVNVRMPTYAKYAPTQSNETIQLLRHVKTSRRFQELLFILISCALVKTL